MRSAYGESFSGISSSGALYVYALKSEEDRIALAHEYVHLAFQHHPRGLDEGFVEATARTLIRTDNPIR